MTAVNKVTINDVGPRDGLQNQPKILSAEERLTMIESLSAANIKNIEIGAFVSSKAVPAMAGTDHVATVLAAQEGLSEGATYSALIPNLRGYELAVDCGIKTVAMVLYGSDSMAQKNVNMSRAQAQDSTMAILARSKQDGVDVIATVAVAFECPFDGLTDAELVRAVSRDFLDAGVSQIVIADTIGAANPAQVSSLMSALVGDHGAAQLSCHFHDTRALGMANVYAALNAGIRNFDASIAGLGGCPFAPGATGNIATEDVVMMVHSMGFETGIDLDQLMVASDLAEQLTGTAPGGRSKPWLKPFLAKQKR